MICFPLDNEEYTASALGAWFATRTRGIFSSDSHFYVTTNGDLTINISPGLAWLKMDNYWGTVVLERDTQVLTSDIADGELSRWDVVCIRLDKNQNRAEIVLKKGEYGIAPAYPEPVRDLDYDEIFIAAINRRAGSTTILESDIVDLRLDSSYCGVMRDGVSEIPTAQLQQQANAILKMIQDELAGINAGTEMMLKTEYAPEAAAVLDNGAILVFSIHQHPQTEYEVCFVAGFDHDPALPLYIDGEPVALFDCDGRPAGKSWQTSDYVRLHRAGSTARVLFPLLNKANEGTPVKWKLLWTGDWSGGSVAIPKSEEYSVFKIRANTGALIGLREGDLVYGMGLNSYSGFHQSSASVFSTDGEAWTYSAVGNPTSYINHHANATHGAQLGLTFYDIYGLEI